METWERFSKKKMQLLERPLPGVTQSALMLVAVRPGQPPLQTRTPMGQGELQRAVTPTGVVLWGV